jgi:hypothetical protein
VLDVVVEKCVSFGEGSGSVVKMDESFVHILQSNTELLSGDTIKGVHWYSDGSNPLIGRGAVDLHMK